MNKTFEHPIAATMRPPEDEQEVIAALILQEIEAERDREERFARSESTLAELARRARAHHANGETTG